MVSIVISARNEEASIAAVIEQCRAYGDEVIVMLGNSTDRTREIAAGLGVKVFADNGKGKGAAIRQAISLVSGEITVFIDADGSHDPHDIPKLTCPILRGEVDHVTASRMLGGSSELHGGFEEFLRLTGSAFITTCINRRFNARLSDSQNGFRATRTSVLRQLDLQENGTTIEQEMIIKLLRKGFSIAEVPSHERERVAGRSSIRLGKVWFRYGYSLVKYLFWQ